MLAPSSLFLFLDRVRKWGRRVERVERGLVQAIWSIPLVMIVGAKDDGDRTTQHLHVVKSLVS
jgi:hypothetical protein